MEEVNAVHQEVPAALKTMLTTHQEQILGELWRHRMDMERLISVKLKVLDTAPTSRKDARCEVAPSVVAVPAGEKPQKSWPLGPLRGDMQEPKFDAGTPDSPGFDADDSQADGGSLCTATPKINSLEEEDEDAKRKLKHARSVRRMPSATQSEHGWAKTSALATLVHSGTFETVAAVLILTNAIFIGIEIELSTRYLDEGIPLSIQVIGFVYTAAFALELTLRVLVHGFSMFWRQQYLWNLLDLFVVLVSLWEVMILVLEAAVDGLTVNAGIGVISSLRIVRILRITRLIRNSGSTSAGAMKFLRALRTLIQSIAYTLKEVMWAGVLLLLIIYIFSLALTQGVVGHVVSAASASDVNPAMIKYWGSIGSSMATCFMAVTGGISWEVAADPLAEISHIFWGLFASYVAFTVFAVLNVMTGVFCQSAIKSAEHDTELMLHNMLAERDEHLKRIKNLFARLDNDGSGSLTLLELEDHLGDPAVQAYFASLDLSITDVWSFFKLLESDAEAEISPDAFFEGCQRLKGFARSLDLAKLMHQTQAMAKKQVDFMNQTRELLEKLVVKGNN